VDKPEIIYKTQTATELTIYNHLFECSISFIPPLTERINITDYSKKIFENATTFEAWKQEELVGLIAAYINDAENKITFITSVSVSNKYIGLGIASTLLNKCIEFVKQKNHKVIKLEVNKNNNPAISFYKKFNFIEIGMKEDSQIMQLQLK
jgi:ribosomal-protein-alanine N-acetyltransferase